MPLRDFPTPVGSDEPFQAKSLLLRHDAMSLLYVTRQQRFGTCFWRLSEGLTPRLQPSGSPKLLFRPQVKFATHHSRPCSQRQSGEVGGHAVPLRDFPTPVGSDEPFQAKSLLLRHDAMSLLYVTRQQRFGTCFWRLSEGLTPRLQPSGSPKLLFRPQVKICDPPLPALLSKAVG